METWPRCRTIPLPGNKARSVHSGAALTANLLHPFRNPGSEEDRRAIAFLLGLISHDDADTPYHFGDDTGPGLQPLTQQAGIPHWAFELGSDLYLAPALTYGAEWFLPEKALLTAYQTLDPNNVYHMNVAKLRFGRAAHQVQYTLEKAAAVVVDPSLVVGTEAGREKLRGSFSPSWRSTRRAGWSTAPAASPGSGRMTWDWLSTYTPVTTISLSPAQPNSDDGAYRQPVTVTLSATDNFDGLIATGPFTTMYSLDGGSPYRPSPRPRD